MLFQFLVIVHLMQWAAVTTQVEATRVAPQPPGLKLLLFWLFICYYTGIGAFVIFLLLLFNFFKNYSTGIGAVGWSKVDRHDPRIFSTLNIKINRIVIWEQTHSISCLCPSFLKIQRKFAPFWWYNIVSKTKECLVITSLDRVFPSASRAQRKLYSLLGEQNWYPPTNGQTAQTGF